MNILWLGGIVLPEISKQENLPVVHVGGWLIQLSEAIGSMPDFNLVYVFDSKKPIKGKTNYYNYYGIVCNTASTKKFGKEYIDRAKAIIKEIQPDIIHIWGTEYAHTLAMVEACKELGLVDKVVISIQGLVSYCYYHYGGYLPFNIIHRFRLRDILKGNLYIAQNNFYKRGELEKSAIQMVKHVIGRTEWDNICAHQINPSIIYHHNNETLRKEFYSGQWKIENCKRHSIFCSQSNYPIKGVHLLIEAVKEVKKIYPDVHLYIGGKNYFNISWYKLGSYGKYLVDLITKNNLKDNVSFLGFLNAEEMKKQYLSANVFVSSSSIENSPNSLGEAMLLGVPCIASFVGGVGSVFKHECDGLVYPADEPYVLAAYIEKIFGDDSLAMKFGESARRHAAITHDPSENLSCLLQIYQDIMES